MPNGASACAEDTHTINQINGKTWCKFGKMAIKDEKVPRLGLLPLKVTVIF